VSRLTIELPLPVRRGLRAFIRTQGEDDTDEEDLIRLLDESDWPGGLAQRFRVVRPLVERVLDGYDAQFLGLLEDPADGLGVWGAGDTTAAAIVTNPTFPSFIKLVTGGYGSRVTEPGHTLIAVNPLWTTPEDVGQRWERDLKAQAAEVMAGWQPLYCCKVLRTPSGATGLLHYAFPQEWQLYATPAEDANEVGPLLLRSQQQPEQSAIINLLNGSREEMRRLAEARGIKQPWRAPWS